MGTAMKARFNSRLAVTLFFLATTAFSQTNLASPTVAQLVGTWQLVSVEDTIEGQPQTAAPYGAHPSGFLMYEPDGHMCATVTDGDRPAWKDPAKASDAEKIAYYDSFVAYCGTYKLDSPKSVVTHYPSVAWTPSYVGSTQPRPFRLEGDKLIITATRGQGFANTKIQKRVLVWQRAKPAAQ